MKKLILKSKIDGIKRFTSIVETKSLESFNNFCLIIKTKTFKNGVLNSYGKYFRYYESFEEMHNEYAFIKKVNSVDSSFTKILEFDEK